MADVPNDLIGLGIKDEVEREGQIDGAEARGQMPAGFGDRIDDEPSDLFGKLRELFNGKLLDILRVIDLVKEPCHGV